MNKVNIWAHRGASTKAPENTLPAFREAIRAGADGLELDVHLTADGEVAVTHDPVIDRVSDGKGRVDSCTLAQLREFDFSRVMPGYPDRTRIPTLREVYELVAPTAMHVNVEIKNEEMRYAGIEEKLTALARECGMEDRVLYSSFNHYTLVRMKAVNPASRIAPLYMAGMYEPEKYALRIGACAIHPMYPSALLPGLAAQCRAAGVDVNPWTVDEERLALGLVKNGVSGLITNEPEKMLALVRGMEASV